MATAEPASNSSGPRYAPDDPTLPKPWKGLMDGNLLYYWNPETNITQYEKPASLAPPLPLGPPPGTSTPKLAAIPMVRTMQSNGVVPQPVQQMAHAPSPQTQQISQTGQQYGHIPQQQQSKGVVPQPIQQMAQAPSPQTQQISQTGQQYGHIPQQLQSNGVVPQPMQQMAQAPSPQTQQVSQTGQQYGHVPQQQTSQIAQVPQHQNQHMSYQGSQIVQVPQQLNQQMSYQGSQMVTPIQQQERLVQQPFRQQTLPHMGAHLSQQPGQRTPQQLGPQMQQQVGPPTDQRTPQQLGPQMQQQSGQQNPLQHGNQFPHPQLQQMSYQQSPSTHGQQVQHQQAQHLSHQQGQQYASHQVPQFKPQQVQKPSFPKREDYDFQQGKQISGPSSQVSHSGVSSLNNMPGVSHSVQIPPIGVQSARPQQYGSSAVDAPQTSSSIQLLQAGSDSMHQPHMSGNIVQNQTRTIVMHSQQSGGPPVGVKMGNEEDVRGRTGNEFYLNPIKDGLESVHQQPKHPAVPMALNQQDMRISRAPPQNVAPGHSGGLNMIAGHAASNMYNHAAGGQAFPANFPPGGPPSRMPPSDLTNLSPAEAYRRQHEVTATGDNVPAPFMTFEDTGFPQQILREIHSAGFSAPTPIQAQTWPIALQSRDIVAIAKTGSGKTLGYLIPAFIHLSICHNNPQRGPTVLVLAPTRELATQIQYEAIKFGRTSRFSCTCLYGGAPKPPQIKELERGAHIVVATPGRLNDILEMKRIDFRQVSLLILDEADRMLDMGFEPQIRKIVNEIPPRRQTLMFTATWPKEVRKIAGDLLVNPVQVNIGNVDELAANKSITQYVEVVPQMQKERRLEQILRTQERGSKIIIFCSTKRLCDQLTRSIGRNFDAAAIHGDKSQGERDSVLNQFRSGKSPILVATDVAARGLDIKDIRVVINYDFPTGIEDYVHRIGRTGRAGATGVAYTFFSDQDWKYAADLVKVLEGANQPVPPEIREMASRSGPSFGRGRGGMNRDSAPGRWGSVGERDGGFGGRGGERDGGFGGRGGDRNGGFGGRGGDRSGGFGSRGSDRDGGYGSRGGDRDGGFGGRGGDRDGGFGGRGGDRDGGFGGRGGRRDFYGGRGNRGGRGFSGPGNGPVGWGRNDRGPDDRYNMDRRGRFNDNRGPPSRSRGRSYSRSPEKVRTWGYSRSPSRSRSRSRSWSRGRSWSRSRSRSYSRSRSRSRSVDRYGRSHRHNATQNFAPQSIAGNSTGPEHSVPLEPTISSISPGMGGGVPPVVESDGPSGPVAAGLDPSFQPVTDQN